MTRSNASYLMKSRHGIWYFQMQIPLKYCFNQQRRIIRKSLRTTDKKVALITSRYWSVRVIENDLRVIETLTPPSLDARGTKRPLFQPNHCEMSFANYATQCPKIMQ